MKRTLFAHFQSLCFASSCTKLATSFQQTKSYCFIICVSGFASKFFAVIYLVLPYNSAVAFQLFKIVRVNRGLELSTQAMRNEHVECISRILRVHKLPLQCTWVIKYAENLCECSWELFLVSIHLFRWISKLPHCEVVFILLTLLWFESLAKDKQPLCQMTYFVVNLNAHFIH